MLTWCCATCTTAALTAPQRGLPAAGAACLGRSQHEGGCEEAGQRAVCRLGAGAGEPALLGRILTSGSDSALSTEITRSLPCSPRLENGAASTKLHKELPLMTAALKDLQIKDAVNRSLITFAGDLLTHPQR